MARNPTISMICFICVFLLVGVASGYFIHIVSSETRECIKEKIG